MPVPASILAALCSARIWPPYLAAWKTAPAKCDFFSSILHTLSGCVAGCPSPSVMLLLYLWQHTPQTTPFTLRCYLAIVLMRPAVITLLGLCPCMCTGSVMTSMLGRLPQNLLSHRCWASCHLHAEVPCKVFPL